MATATREGVIKFQLDFRPGPPPEAPDLVELDAWRDVLLRHGLIGQNPDRYDGLGFGNLSRRAPGRSDNAFIISGTQTGHLKQLAAKDYATVLQCDPLNNRLMATGQIKPSSEALSHGILYQSSAAIQWVMHLHSPDIFHHALSLNLPQTDPDAAYGTPEMASEIQQLAHAGDGSIAGLLVMAGHQDGILAYGPTAEATGELVMTTLHKALSLS